MDSDLKSITKGEWNSNFELIYPWNSFYFENSIYDKITCNSCSPSTEKKYLNLDKFEALNQAAIDVNPKVNDLARAILQIEQSIELHYLKPPLGNFTNDLRQFNFIYKIIFYLFILLFIFYLA